MRKVDNIHRACISAEDELETSPSLAVLYLWQFPSLLDPLDRRACSHTIYRIASTRVTQLARNRAESYPLSSRVAELFSAMTRNAQNQCHLAVFANAKGLSSRSEKFAFTTNARAPRCRIHREEESTLPHEAWRISIFFRERESRPNLLRPPPPPPRRTVTEQSFISWCNGEPLIRLLLRWTWNFLLVIVGFSLSRKREILITGLLNYLNYTNSGYSDCCAYIISLRAAFIVVNRSRFDSYYFDIDFLIFAQVPRIFSFYIKSNRDIQMIITDFNGCERIRSVLVARNAAVNGAGFYSRSVKKDARHCSFYLIVPGKQQIHRLPMARWRKLRVSNNNNFTQTHANDQPLSGK